MCQAFSLWLFYPLLSLPFFCKTVTIIMDLCFAPKRRFPGKMLAPQGCDGSWYEPSCPIQNGRLCGWHHQATAKRSQHVNATYRSIVERNMLRRYVWPPCSNVLWHVGCCWLEFEIGQIWANNIQHGQTHPACCAQQCCDISAALACCDRLTGALVL